MGDVINLNQFRKDRARRDRQDAARENRARFGRTGAAKAAGRRAAARARQGIENKKLDAPATPGAKSGTAPGEGDPPEDPGPEAS